MLPMKVPATEGVVCVPAPAVSASPGSVMLGCCLVTKSCPPLCDPMDCCTPGASVLCYLLEFAQIHVHWVSDVIEPSQPLPPFSFCLQYFSASESSMIWLFTSGGQSVGASAIDLLMNIQDWFPLGLTGLFSLQSKELSRVVYSTIIQSINSLALSLYGPTLTSIHDY